VSARRDEDFTAYVQARLAWLRRVAYLLCQDWQQADDLVQTAITTLYVHWRRARAMQNVDGYVRAILVRAFLSERRGGWARRLRLAAPGVPRAANGVISLPSQLLLITGSARTGDFWLRAAWPVWPSRWAPPALTPAWESSARSAWRLRGTAPAELRRVRLVSRCAG
jgi:DNA-directed RNA polymerase specialized sigma24 family protein